MPSKVFHDAKALPGARQTQSIHEMFESLLWTAFVQVHRGRIPPPAGVPDWWSLPADTTALDLEVQYGIGTYDERKIQLHIALEALLMKRKPVDVETIYQILNKAKYNLAHWWETQNELDDRREVETERRVVVENHTHWAGRMQRFLHLELDEPTMSAQPVARALRQNTTPPQKPPDNQLTQLLEALMPLLLDHDRRHPREHLRRPARSGPPSPMTEIIIPTKKALAKAGATGWIRIDLLAATGLTLLGRGRT